METTKRIYAPHELQPSTPIHPGEILKDELEARGLSQRKFAQTIGVSYSVFNEVVNGKRPITTEYALKIEAATGINAEFWRGMQSDYDMQTARHDGKLSAGKPRGAGLIFVKHPQGCGDALTSKRMKARRKAVFRLRVPFFSYIELTLLTNSLR